MVTLFYLLSLLEILFILESMESRFLLLKLEDPTLEVDAPDIGKSNPFLPETIGSYYSNIIIIFYLLCHFIYVFHLSDVSLVSIFLMEITVCFSYLCFSKKCWWSASSTYRRM